MIRVVLPSPLRTLAGVSSEVNIDVGETITVDTILDAIEAKYPMLRGTMRDQSTRIRRPFIRFYAGEEDISHEPTDGPLPAPVAAGTQPLVVVGAMAGG